MPAPPNWSQGREWQRGARGKWWKSRWSTASPWSRDDWPERWEAGSWGASGTGAAGADWGRTTKSLDGSGGSALAEVTGAAKGNARAGAGVACAGALAAGADEVKDVVDGLLRAATFPRDSFTTSSDQVLQITVTSSGEDRHRASVRLPAMCPVRTYIVSDWFAKVDEAKVQVKQRAYEEIQRLVGVAESSSDVLDCSGVGERSRQLEAIAGSDCDMNDILRRSPQPAEVWILRLDVQLGDCGETDTDRRFGLLVPPALADFALTLKIVGRGSGEPSGAARLAPFCMRWPPLPSDCFQPVELIQRYHEAFFYTMLPQLRPSFGLGDAVDENFRRLSKLAIVVRLLDSENGVSIDWQSMQEFVEEDTKKQVLHALMSEENEEPEDDDVLCSAFAWDLSGASAAGGFDAGYLCQVPHWLLAVIHRTFRLLRLRKMAASGFVGPVRWHPLLLDFATTLPRALPRDGSFGVLCYLGSRVLRAAVSLAVFALGQEKTCVQLEKQLEKACGAEALASLARRLPVSSEILQAMPDLASWGPPGVSSIAAQGAAALAGHAEVAELGKVFEALVAMHFLQQPSGFAAAALFWHRTASSGSGAGVGVGRVPSGQTRGNAGRIDLLFGHYFAGCEERFQGRTPTIVEISEVLDDNLQGSALRVHYEWKRDWGDEKDGHGWLDYARLERPMERTVKPGGEWKQLHYDVERSAYVSANMRDDSGVPRLLPNKVFSYLSGKPTCDLISLRLKGGSKRQILEVVSLQEKLEGDSVLSLRVECSKKGSVVYRRGSGGDLGIECSGSDGEQCSPIIYSESLKTLVSPRFQVSLPTQVIEWLQGKCLACLLHDFKAGGKASDVTCGDELGATGRDGRVVKYGFKCVRGSFIFFERRAAKVTPPGAAVFGEELIYSQEHKTWLSPAQSTHAKPVPVEDMVSSWISAVLQREKEPALTLILADCRMAPWRFTPSVSQSMVPRSFEVAFIETRVLMHTFRNPLILVEAMTHSSYKEGLTSDFQQLAVLGAALVELLVAKLLTNLQGVPLVTTGRELLQAAVGPERLDTCALADDDAAARRMVSESELVAAHTETCNHTAYARACVHMNLHKHILHDSEYLGRAVDVFAEALQRAERGDATKVRAQRERLKAPRALGDVFLACAAAIFLDSDWGKFVLVFQEVVKKHVLRAVHNSIDSIFDKLSTTIDRFDRLRVHM